MTMSIKHFCKIISVANQKGGVAKTTSAVNLATAISMVTNASGRANRVLLIDNDPQANLTESLAMQPDSPEFEGLSTCDLYTKSIDDGFDPLDLVFTVDSMPHLSMFLIPSTMLLSVTDKDLYSDNAGISRFIKNVREGLAPAFDYIFIDNSPALSSTLLAALACADSVIIPTKTERLSVTGLHYLYDTINDVRNNVSGVGNPNLKIRGLIGTIYKKSQEQNEVVEMLRKDTEHPLLGIVPYSPLVSKAIEEGRAVVEARPKSAPAKAYTEIAGLL